MKVYKKLLINILKNLMKITIIYYYLFLLLAEAWVVPQFLQLFQGFGEEKLFPARSRTAAGRNRSRSQPDRSRTQPYRSRTQPYRSRTQPVAAAAQPDRSRTQPWHVYNF